MYRIQNHDIGFKISATGSVGKNKEEYIVDLIFPETFDRPHFGNIDILKVVQEIILEVNATGIFGSKDIVSTLLRKTDIDIPSEITDLTDLKIHLKLLKSRGSKQKTWQWWQFKLNDCTGSATVCCIH